MLETTPPLARALGATAPASDPASLLEQLATLRVPVVPECCRHCQQLFSGTEAPRGGRVWRHQVVELLPLAVRVTEYPMGVRRCAACGRRTRAGLPAGVPRRPFGPRLMAGVATCRQQGR